MPVVTSDSIPSSFLPTMGSHVVEGSFGWLVGFKNFHRELVYLRIRISIGELVYLRIRISIGSLFT